MNVEKDLDELEGLAENVGEYGILAKGLLLILNRLDEIEGVLLDISDSLEGGLAGE